MKKEQAQLQNENAELLSGHQPQAAATGRAGAAVGAPTPAGYHAGGQDNDGGDMSDGGSGSRSPDLNVVNEESLSIGVGISGSAQARIVEIDNTPTTDSRRQLNSSAQRATSTQALLNNVLVSPRLGTWCLPHCPPASSAPLFPAASHLTPGSPFLPCPPQQKVDPPCPRERHMCCQITPFGSEWGHAPSILLMGGTGGSASAFTYKGVPQLDMITQVLAPEPHVLVLHGLSRFADM